METGFDLSKQKIAIIGLGLMGGSLALALRGTCQKILAVDQNPETIRFATQHQIVDKISDSPQEILPQADVIILATPVLTILKLIESLPEWKPEGAVVIDLGSTKQLICQALAQLPNQFSAVGGHPMCGKTEFTLKNAEADLFRGSPFVLVNLPNSTPFSIRLAEAIAVNIGAQPLWLDAETHDQLTAITSHFPFLLANLMAGITPQEAAPLTATGWLSTTRLASSSLQMMADILKTNRLQVLSVLAQFSKQLDLVRVLLENQNFDNLTELLTTGKEQHQDIITKEHLSS
jgi:prephenate dehydrogenase